MRLIIAKIVLSYVAVCLFFSAELLADLFNPAVATTCALTESAEALMLAVVDSRSSNFIISKNYC